MWRKYVLPKHWKPSHYYMASEARRKSQKILYGLP
jgi:hypothetical protein